MNTGFITAVSYTHLFKGRDADALTAAFTEYTGKKVRTAQKTERPSVLARLSQFKELVKHAVVDRNKRKELELSLIHSSRCHIYKGADHKHEAQKPAVWEF